jgi:UDPglucose 6-dehydrogenase
MARIVVSGTGYVGLVTGACFAEVGHEVTCVDVDQTRIAALSCGICPIFEESLEALVNRNLQNGRLRFTTDYALAYGNAEVIFIGVGTPELPDGSADLSYIFDVSEQIAGALKGDCLVVIKSTVPVGTNDRVEMHIQSMLPRGIRIEIASNPEFLAQGSAVRDTLKAQRIVIGTNSAKAEQTLREIYAPFALPIVSVCRRSAEMIKYASNVFLALKISYMNDVANLCELVGADIIEVAKGMSYDDRIGARFLNAGIGYGGSCFPKDTKALARLGELYGYKLRTVRAAIDVNSDQKTVLMRKAKKRIADFAGLRVAVLGLTFKPGTDDIREAPSLDNIALLLKRGAFVTAYDPKGEENVRRRFVNGECKPGSLGFAGSALEALNGADACFVFTEWDEIRSIAPEAFAAAMRGTLVFDGRNVYDAAAMRAAGIEYHCIGRG